MPASFTRLRIQGFKSFAEPATVEVLPGLTGIVGPNGCGKSNVVEALRWAMGESSARSLRGGDMDDVIFAGTGTRAARNIADVTLVLEDTRNLAPPPFHEQETLEISRRIERGGGSAYRINGTVARARDVQTLFADLASGARASAMVSQGRVGALVGARPEERRAILEEAAGITGLHARRHEAELKLRAAEANLSRAEDLRGQLETQAEALRRQARQAARYRVVSAGIRSAEAELLSLQRAKAEALRLAAKAALAEAQSGAAGAAAEAAGATAEAEAAGLTLPGLREAEAVARTALERHRLGLERIDSDIARAEAGLAAGRQQAARLRDDHAHAVRQAREAEIAVTRLDEETGRLEAAQDGHASRAEAAQAAVSLATETTARLEAETNLATEQAAELAARHRAASEAVALASRTAQRLAGQHAALMAEQARLALGIVPASQLAAAHEAAVAAAARADLARRDLDAAERARTAALAEAAAVRDAAQQAAARGRATTRVSAEALRSAAAATLSAARTALQAAAAELAGIAAEHRALAEVLGVKDGARWPRLIDQLSVPEGLEQALGAALGEELDSAADPEAPRHWRATGATGETMPALPQGALAMEVGAPALLARALSQIGLVEQATPALMTALQPGQSLVSRAGGLWRWDGYTVREGTRTTAAVRLAQSRRLAALADRLAEADALAVASRARVSEATSADTAARAAADAEEQAGRQAADRAEAEGRRAAKAIEDGATEVERAARLARTAAEQAMGSTRAEAARLEAQSAAAAARGAGLAEQLARTKVELDEAETHHTAQRALLSEMADLTVARAALDASRAALARARGQEKSAGEACDALIRAAQGRAGRLRHIVPERADWVTRQRDSASRVADLAARTEISRAEIIALEQAPVLLVTERQEARVGLGGAEASHRRASETLIAAEASLQAADRAARAAEATLAGCRERLVRAEGEAQQADHAWGTVTERILEKLGATPELPPPPTDIGPDAEEKHRRRHERLLREREEMGPVNLLAETEATALETRIGDIARERDELGSAIAKLRGSIGHLNREGRERLSAVFAEVDRHFQQLFGRMFGGGRAHLALVGSDDPLTAGLEIYAQPPGKKLASLSLLSGGEQALTALSLIFAVFRCNPAPICVLDEVDAPLDDANVDRFCTLLEDMVRETGTRFLVVTHHAHTMARMDRLYGVTMQERGVSRLLSVDLQLAEAMVDGNAMAAE